MMRARKLTIGDAVGKTHVFRSPHSLRRNLSPRNLHTINHFQDVLDQYWRTHEKAKSEPQHGIFFNKVLSELIRETPALQFILRAWYLYGIDIIKPNHTQSLTPPTIQELAGTTGFTTQEIEAFDRRIVAIAKLYDCNATPWTWERRQYESYGNELYLAKLDLQVALSNNDTSACSKAISTLYLQTFLKRPTYQEAADTMLTFLDTAKIVIITNNKIPNHTKFRIAFDKTWRYFSTINLSLTAEGDQRELLQAFSTPKDRASLRDAAEQAIRNLALDIKTDATIKLTLSPVQQAVLATAMREP